MGATFNDASSLKRLAYALLGLVAGDTLLLLYLMQNALRVRSALLGVHMGEPSLTISNAIEHFSLLVIFTFVGWLFVGIPVALLFSARSIARLSWPVALAVGAALGPIALLVILLLLGHGHIYFSSGFNEPARQFAYLILISTVAFAVYRALLQKQSQS
ncbi:MAG: hypothetical protein ACRD3L_04310 [Terriglobales bacterium]